MRAPTSSRIVSSASSTRDCSRSRRTTGTSSLRTKSVASCVAIRPAPTMPTFCTRRGFTSGRPAPFFVRRSTTVNAYAEACACGDSISSAMACSSAAYPSSIGQSLAPSIRSSATYGARVAPCTASSTRERAFRSTASRSDQSGATRSTLSGRADEVDRELQRLVEELDRLEQPVGETELERLRRGQELVLAKRVEHDQLRGGLRPDQARRQLRSAPGRDDRERDLGEADVPDVRLRWCARRSAARARARRRVQHR